MTLLVSVDEGSTSNKLAYLDNGEVVSLVTPVSFRKGWKNANFVTRNEIYNYEIDGVKYTYDETSENSIESTQIEFQYSHTNLLSVHHALLNSGLEPQDVKLIVTLPITLFYNAEDAQRNDENVRRKKEHIMREVSVNKRTPFNIVDVEVVPESASACLSLLEDMQVGNFSRTLCIDVGGTTTDMSLVVGQYREISGVYGNSKLGVSKVTNVARNALIDAESFVSHYVANEFIKRRNERELCLEIVNDSGKLDTVLTKIENAIDELGQEVADEALKACKNPNNILIFGGGASLVEKRITEAYPAIRNRIVVLPDSQTRQSVENLLFFASQEENTMTESAVEMTAHG
ncbi:plasmid segregation protein ParM domain-containing protein [Vibrio breoganii]